GVLDPKGGWTNGIEQFRATRRSHLLARTLARHCRFCRRGCEHFGHQPRRSAGGAADRVVAALGRRDVRRSGRRAKGGRMEVAQLTRLPAGQILLAYGTRPEAIKLGPVAAELKAANVPFSVLATGQHTELLAGTPAESDLA